MGWGLERQYSGEAAYFISNGSKLDSMESHMAP